MDDMDFNELDLMLLSVSKLTNNAESYAKECNKRVSQYDAETQDLLHYLENEKLSAAKLAKLVVALRKIRIKRRKHKQFGAVVNALVPTNCCKKSTALSAMRSYKTQHSYEVRTNILKEVFGDERKKLDF